MTAQDSPTLLPTMWIMHTAEGWYPVQPSSACKPEDHGRLNAHVLAIEDIDGTVLWSRTVEGPAQ